MNESSEMFGFNKYMQINSQRQGFDSAAAERIFYEEKEDESASASSDSADMDDDDYDEAFEGAVSVITNKDAREIALKAYKSRKASRKSKRGGK